APRGARRGARDATRGARHVPAGERVDARGARPPRRALRGAAGGVEADPERGPGARRRHDDRARAGDARARRAARGADGAVRHAGVRLPARGRAPDELPPPALDPARARDGVRRRRADAPPLRARDRRALPLLLLRRRDAGPLTCARGVTLLWQRLPPRSPRSGCELPAHRPERWTGRHTAVAAAAAGHEPRDMTAFAATAIDGAARAGVLRTAHGEVRTPVFMPVGTKATVKSLDPQELTALGAQIVLGNAYHLHFRPGDALIAELGGLHGFMGWERPLLTDSGGYQVFSLRDTILAVDDDGVTFRSVYDGAAARFTPELAAEIQRNLGSDVAMCLDQVPPAGVPRRQLEDAVRRTTDWARRQRHAPRAEGQLRFGITQGGTDEELRRRSTEEIAELDFDGNAIGGLSV